MAKWADIILPLGLLGAVAVAGYFLFRKGEEFFKDWGLPFIPAAPVITAPPVVTAPPVGFVWTAPAEVGRIGGDWLGWLRSIFGLKIPIRARAEIPHIPRPTPMETFYKRFDYRPVFQPYRKTIKFEEWAIRGGLR